MTAKRIVVVLGATGVQGGSIVQSLIQDGTFQPRAVTRNASSDSAKKLAALGSQVVEANANDKTSLINAFKDAYAVFALTNFWDKEIVMGDHSMEEKQGKLIADAAEECGVHHFIYSSLPYTEKISHGKYTKIIHFDGKARVEEYIRSSKKLDATFVLPGYYNSNLIYMSPAHKNAEGVYEFTGPCSPDTLVAGSDPATDMGPVVLSILKKGPKATKNESIPVASEYISFRKIAEAFTKITGKSFVYKQLARQDYFNILASQMGPVVAEEFIQMLEYFQDFGYYGGASLDAVKQYNPNMTSFEQWLKNANYVPA